MEIGTSQEVQLRAQYYDKLSMVFWWMTSYWILDAPKPYLVGEVQWLKGELTIIQCAHGDAIAYPLAAIELEIQENKCG